VAAEFLIFGALIHWACRKVLPCPPWLTKTYHSIFQESLWVSFMFLCNNNRRVGFPHSFIRLYEVSQGTGKSETLIEGLEFCL
jgi:hypothetical protein